MNHAPSSVSKPVSTMTCLIVGAIALAVYVRTLLPGVDFWDTGEFQTVAYVLGIAHPTGYPLYILLGKLFTFLPLGSIAYRMNVMSAVSAACAASGLAAIALRLGVRPVLALAAALTFAFSPNVWETANHADPHTLHVAITAWLWWLSLVWVETQDRRWLWGFSLCLGLGLGNHMLMAMELPAFALLVLGARLDVLRCVRDMGPAIACGLLGLSVYAYLPLRSRMHPVLDYGHPATWHGFHYVVFADQFRGQMGFLSPNGLMACWARLPEVMGWYGDWFSPFGRQVLFALALVGGWRLFERQALLAISLLLGIAVPFYAACGYQNAELGRYFFVSNLLLLVLAAVAVETVLQWVAGKGRTIAKLLAIAVLLAPAALAHTHWAEADQHDRRDAEVYARDLYAELKPNAVVLAWWSLRTPLWYESYVEGRRPDVHLADDGEGFTLDSAGLKATLARYYPERPVYLILDPTQISQASRWYRLRLLPPLTRFQQDLYEVVGPSLASGAASPTSPRR